MKSYMESFGKIECPFVRDDKGIVTPQIEEGYEWVFEDPNVLAVEKLDGENLSVYMQNGQLIGLRKRDEVISCGNLDYNSFINSVRKAYTRGRLPLIDGVHYGEAMNTDHGRNFLDLDEPDWFAFDYCKANFAYESFHKYEKTFENLSSWFKDWIFSLAYNKYHAKKKFPEGIVFYHPDGRMAKLRRDMFEFFSGARHKEII